MDKYQCCACLWEYQCRRPFVTRYKNLNAAYQVHAGLHRRIITLLCALSASLNEADAEDLHSALCQVYAPAFEIEFSNVGYFGKLRKAHSVWADMDRCPSLEELQAKVENVIQRAGLTLEKRKFKPHVTLARIKGETGHHLANFLSEHGTFRLPPMTVDHFLLYRSHLAQEGAFYEPLARYDLDGAFASNNVSNTI